MVNKKQTLDLHAMSKQSKALNEHIDVLEKQLAKYLHEKLDTQTRLEQVELALAEMSDRYTVIRNEHKALQETNTFLDKKVRDLSQENHVFLASLMDLKEKQIEKYNEAHELYKEVESMRMKLEFANLPPEALKNINEIMSMSMMSGIQEEGG